MNSSVNEVLFLFCEKAVKSVIDSVSEQFMVSQQPKAISLCVRESGVQNRTMGSVLSASWSPGSNNLPDLDITGQ